MVIVFVMDYAGNRHGWIHAAGVSTNKLEVLCPTTVQVECTWFHVCTYSKRTVKEWWISQCLNNWQHCLISTHKNYVFVTLTLYLRHPGTTWVSLSRYTVKRNQNNLLWLLEILVSPWSYTFCNICWRKSCRIYIFENILVKLISAEVTQGKYNQFYDLPYCVIWNSKLFMELFVYSAVIGSSP